MFPVFIFQRKQSGVWGNLDYYEAEVNQARQISDEFDARASYNNTQEQR